MTLQLNYATCNHDINFHSIVDIKKYMGNDYYPNYTILNDNFDIIEMKVNNNFVEKWDGKHCKNNR